MAGRLIEMRPDTRSSTGETLIAPAAHVGAARAAVLRGLKDFTEATVGPANAHNIALTLRRDGAFVGGFVGVVSFGWLFVEALWVEADVRGSGHGRALMVEGEAEARRLGASNSFLNTFSFQAPAFYERLGYSAYVRLDDFPAGHQRIFMTKAL